MTVNAALSVDLALLTQALDRPEIDIVETLHEFAADARTAVPSYLGLSLTIARDTPFTCTVLEDLATPEDVRSSLLMPLRQGGTETAATDSAVILYGAQPGALVDLAADLSWLTGVQLDEYALDQHLPTIGTSSTPPTIHATSVINQAIGVLVGSGHPPEEAHQRLTAQAVDAGVDRYGAAVRILTALSSDADTEIDRQ